MSSALKEVSKMLIERINKQMIDIDEMKTKGGKNFVTQQFIANIILSLVRQK